jgi:DNA polymerase-4
MNRLGIHTGADLKAQSLEFLEQYFGRSGAYYYAIARGHDERRVVPDRPRKSVGSETTFMEDLGKPQEIVDGVLVGARRLSGATASAPASPAARDRESEVRRLPDHHPQPTLAAPVNSRAELEQTSVELVRQIFPLEKRVRLLGFLNQHGAAQRRAGTGAAIDARSVSASLRGGGAER